MSKNILFNNIVDKRKTGKKIAHLLQTQDDIYDAIEHAKFNWDKMTSTQDCSTTDNTEHVFQFSNIIFSDAILRFKTDNSAVWDIGHYAGGRLIVEFEWTAGDLSCGKYWDLVIQNIYGSIMVVNMDKIKEHY